MHNGNNNNVLSHFLLCCVMLCRIQALCVMMCRFLLFKALRTFRRDGEVRLTIVGYAVLIVSGARFDCGLRAPWH